MQKHLQLAVVMLFSSSAMVAQNTTSQQPTKPLDENLSLDHKSRRQLCSV